MSLTLSVPGTLSNLGPGFDVLGFAVSLHNRFKLTPEGDAGHFRDSGGEPSDEHLVARTVRAAEARFGEKLSHGLALEQEEAVPRARGLGSSATARVAGLLAWSHFAEHELTLDEALAFLVAAEGHADNALAAMLGGITVAGQVGGHAHHVRLEPPAELRVVLCVPEVEVATEQARGALPDSYCRADVVATLGSLALLMHGLATADPVALRAARGDRVHHPYRAPLIGPVDAVLDAAEEVGAAAAFISGSGSTLAALIAEPWVEPLEVARAMERVLEEAGIEASALVVSAEPEGAWARFQQRARHGG